MKIHKFKKHHYLLLIAVAIIAFLAVIRFQFYPQLQFLILSTLVCFYLIWALLNHHFNKSLKLEIMVEYFLTAGLALIFLYGLLL